MLSPEEVGRLLEAAPGPGLKYEAALSIAHGAGLRAGEVVMLRVSGIEFKAHADPRRARQGPQGPARNALTTAPHTLARVEATVSLARLAVLRPRSGAADHDTAAEPCLLHGGLRRRRSSALTTSIKPRPRRRPRR